MADERPSPAVVALLPADFYEHSRFSAVNHVLYFWFVDFIFGTRKSGEVVQPDKAKDFLDSITKEIAAEHTLVTSRMTWNLSFQGFLFAGYGLAISRVASNDMSDLVYEALSRFLRVLAVSGMITAASALIGILAAFTQINKLKRLWYQNNVELLKVGPQPFSGWLGSFAGRIPPLAIACVIIWAWYWLYP